MSAFQWARLEEGSNIVYLCVCVIMIMAEVNMVVVVKVDHQTIIFNFAPKFLVVCILYLHACDGGFL